MFCPNCGTNNPDGSKFCSECGTVFESVKAPEADTPAPTVDEILGEIKSEPVVQPAPAEPEQPAPAEPEQPAPVELAKPAPAEPAQPVPEPAQSVPEPVQPVEQAQPAPQPVPEQPVAPSVPVQPAQPVVTPAQPAPQQQVPQYQQPAYAQPAAPVPKPPKPPRKPLDAKQKKLLIIGGSCGAVLVAFLIVLFAAIIPHSGLKGKLRYSWTRVDSTRSANVLNLKKKSWTVGSKTYKIKSWNAKGDRMVITYMDNGTIESETFVVAFSPDGKKVYLFDAIGYDDGDRPDYVFARGNSVQSDALGTLPW